MKLVKFAVAAVYRIKALITAADYVLEYFLNWFLFNSSPA